MLSAVYAFRIECSKDSGERINYLQSVQCVLVWYVFKDLADGPPCERVDTETSGGR